MRKLLSFVFIVLILAPFALSESDITLNLSSDTVGENQPFGGTLNLAIDGNNTVDSPIYFYINNELAYNITLKEALKNIQGIKTYPESYKSTVTNSKEVSYNFEKEGRLINAAIKLDAPANSIKYTNNLSFSLTGLKSGLYPDSVYVDINNDGVIDYTYKGALIDQYEYLDKSNLADKTEPDSYAAIKAQGSSVYCSETFVKPSSSYKLYVTAKQGNDWSSALPLKGIIAETPLKAPACGLDDAECCTFTQPTQDSSEISCNLKQTFDSEKKAYICLFVLDGLSDQLPYEIGYFKNSSIAKSYINGKQTDKNFFMSGQRQLYNTTLVSKVNIKKDASELKNIIGSLKSDIIPITIFSKTNSIVKISDLNFKYETDVPISLTTFNQLDYYPETIYYSGTVSIPLSSFKNLTADEASEDNEIYVSFNDHDSNQESFDIVEGSSLLIQRTTDNAYLGQVIEFLGSSEENLTSYAWNFGDNTTSTGKHVTHSYSTEGEYTVTLTATNEDNITSQTAIIIKVASLKDSISFLVQDTKEKVDSMNTKVEASQESKEVLTYLGILDQIKSLSTNLTLINNTVVSILANLKLNTSDLNTKLIAIKPQIDAIRLVVPTDFSISQVSFTPRASDMSQIPSAETLGLTDLDAEEKILKYQETASVSGTMYIVDLTYIGSESKLTLVKKTASGQGTYYEQIPQDLAVKSIITQNYKVVVPNLYQFQSADFVYTFEGDVMNSALQTATLVVPADLSSIQVQGKELKTSSVCGDNVCDTSSETATSCPQDCTKSKPWWVIILVLVILGAGLFVIYRFKDKLFVARSKPVASKLFANEKDYQNVKKYIESSLRRGFTDMQIDLALKKQGWKSEQIAYVLNEAKDRQKMLKK